MPRESAPKDHQTKTFDTSLQAYYVDHAEESSGSAGEHGDAADLAGKIGTSALRGTRASIGDRWLAEFHPGTPLSTVFHLMGVEGPAINERMHQMFDRAENAGLDVGYGDTIGDVLGDTIVDITGNGLPNKYPQLFH